MVRVWEVLAPWSPKAQMLVVLGGGGFRVLILFIYFPLQIIVSVNQQRLDKGFHAVENSYMAPLEGDRQRRFITCFNIHSVAQIDSFSRDHCHTEQGVKSESSSKWDIWHFTLVLPNKQSQKPLVTQL